MAGPSTVEGSGGSSYQNLNHLISITSVSVASDTAALVALWAWGNRNEGDDI